MIEINSKTFALSVAQTKHRFWKILRLVYGFRQAQNPPLDAMIYRF